MISANMEGACCLDLWFCGFAGVDLEMCVLDMFLFDVAWEWNVELERSSLVQVTF